MLQELRVKEFPHNVQQLEQFIEELEQKMIDSERSGKYQEAEGCRLDISEGKRRLENKRLHEMTSRQNDERKELESAHQDEIKEFLAFWNSKENDQIADGKKSLDQMKRSHEEETRETIKLLQSTLPSKVKQKMEQHMSKQKLYVDAHQVQSRISSLLQSQTAEWERQKRIKIDIRVAQLRDKHNLQLSALQKKISTSLDQLNVNRTKQLQRLQLKYVNIKEDQRASHQKEQLTFKGEFKSKTSISTSGSRSRG